MNAKSLYFHPPSRSHLVHGEVLQTYRREESMKLLSEMLWWVSLRFKFGLIGFLLFAPVTIYAEEQGLGFGNRLPKIESRYQYLETFARALFYLETMYVDPDQAQPEKIVQDALEGVVSKLDPHTVLMPRKAFEQLTIDTKGNFGGVGIIVSQERGKLIIVSPIEETPAMKAGVQSGDEIIAINDKLLDSMSGKEAVDMMRGRPGSILKLTIRRKGEKDPLVFEMVREIIKVKSVRGMALTEDIFYIKIASFQEKTNSELAKLLQKNSAKMKGLVLDLRDNPGGLLDQSVKVVDTFVESGLIVSTVGRDPDRIEREFAHKKGTFHNFPMVVLMNAGSASASEIVAGALQDHQRALILGTTSFGKGSVQTLVSLPDGSGLKLTVARYYTPNDRSIQAKGIIPDIIVNRVPAINVKKNHKRESDLSGHIDGENLSSFSEKSGILHTVKNWPEQMQKDLQLVTAFTYVKGWSIFKKN